MRDGAAALERCLTALDAQDHPADRLSVLVVDNGSTEDVASVVARHPRAVLLSQPRGGSYAARNTGIAASTSEVLAFTDADCEPRPDWVSAAVAALSAPPRAAMVGGAVELTYEHGRPVTACELFEAVRGFPQQQYVEQYRFAVTANMVTWRRTIEEVGDFDLEILSGGDYEWGNRVAAAGGLQRYAPSAVVRHPARSTWGESVRKWRRVARGRIAMGYTERVRFELTRLVWREGRAILLEVPRSLRYEQLRSPGQRARYLAANAVHHLIAVRTFAPVWVRSLLPGGLRST